MSWCFSCQHGHIPIMKRVDDKEVWFCPCCNAPLGPELPVEKIEKELKEQKETERLRLAEIESKKQAELSKGDLDKVKDLINDLTELKTKYTFKSAKNSRMYYDVGLLIDKVVNHIKK